jgi:DNA-directed RNA polymerase subunit RPC12/RpoP
MAFMELEMTSKGSLYSCECGTCSRTLYAHEWADDEFNEMRDLMMSGKLRCHHCAHKVDRSTFSYRGKQYAGRYSASGYMDCTDWEYDTNKRRLERSLRSLYA